MLQEGSGRLATESGWFDLKRDPGGIVDIEFVVQYLVLAHAHRFPALTRWSDNIRILDSLKETGVLPEEQANALVSAYLAYRSAVHVAALEGVAAVGESVVFMPHLERVKAIRDHWLPNAGLDEAS
jgi:glutamate-ammonia-ligase adenylyltransferase